ncbi:MAG TPA: hypothetical protein VHZ51_23610 [Ktedonobacteraceae bacterium]|jgi:hypothetical protein|nr:hypothetical protein [Ktedonobacteraceae bacterium]
MQQTQPRYKVMRRLLFPYNGEEPLSQQQTWRVIIAWTSFFPLILALAMLPVIIAVKGPLPWQMLLVLFLLTLLLGIVIFGFLAWFAVFMINRTALLVQRSKQTSSTNGGRYGS